MQSRTVRFMWAAGLGWGYQLFAMIVGLWLTKYLVERLGDSTMGWWTHALVMVSYITTVDFGLSALLPRDIAKETGISGGWKRAIHLPEVIGKWTKFAILQLPFAAGIAVLCVVVMARNDESNTSAAICVMGIALMLYPFRIGGLVVNGLQDFRYEGIVQFIAFSSGVLVTVALSRFYSGPVSVISGWTTQLSVASAMMWTRGLILYRGIIPTLRQIREVHTPWNMVGTGFWAWLSGVGVTMTSTAEIVALGFFAKEADLFNYSCTTKLIIVLTPLALTIGAAMLPGLTELRSGGHSAAMEEATVIYSQIILGISGFFGCLILTLTPGFLEWWLKTDNRYFGGFVIGFAVLAMNFKHFINTLAIALFSLSRETALWRLTFINGLMSILLTFSFVSFFGPRGAAIGPAIAQSIGIPVALYMIYTRAPGLAIRLVRSALVWGGFYVAAAVCCYRYLRPMVGTTLTDLAWYGIAAGLCYSIAIAIPTIRSEAWQRILRILPFPSFRRN